jgi:hypothetical protein
MADVVSTRPLLDKLGVRPKARVALVGLDEPWFEELLADRTDAVDHGSPKAAVDLVFLAADSPSDLAPLRSLRAAIAPSGAIWVVFTKGRRATLRDLEVMEAARNAGLVDNKVVSFSETKTSVRLAIRVADRAAAAAASGDSPND